MAGNLDAIDHIVVLMLENRSFDNMLGYLYANRGNRSPLGHAFEGLTGNESNSDANGNTYSVFPITPATPMAYFMPGVNPGERFAERTMQLFGQPAAPATAPNPTAPNSGYVKDFETRLTTAPGKKVEGTTANAIMGCFTPEMLPVLSGLATGFAVCDMWFSSVPTETLPNRAFAFAGTSLGWTDNPPSKLRARPTFNTPSIFGRLADANKQWRIYGCTKVYTMNNFPDTMNDHWRCGMLTDFKNDARNGTLPEFALIEPGWSGPGQSDQHPVSDVSAGEQLIADVYYTLRNGKDWNSTLLIIVYDEPGGCYDHVPPPWSNKVAPPDTPVDPNANSTFDFKRLGPRVPAVLVSPLIRAGTVFRVDDAAAPLDHTTIIKTVRTRWQLPKLTARDEAASDLGAVLTLSSPRADDPLQGIQVPHYDGPNPFVTQVTGPQELHADALEAHPMFGEGKAKLPKRPNNAVEFDNHIRFLDEQIRAKPSQPAPSGKAGT